MSESEKGPSLRTRVLFVLALAAIVTLSGTSLLLFKQRAASTRRVQQSLRLTQNLDGLLSALRDAETGQRGFLLTGSPGYLEPYRAGIQEVPIRLAKLGQDLADRREDAPRLARLATVARAKLEEMKETIDLASRDGVEEARAVIDSGRGKQLMDEMRGLVGEMLASEEQSFTAMEQRQAQFGVLLIASSLGGGLFLVVLTVLGFLAARRDLRNAERILDERARTADYQQRATSILAHDIRTPLTAARLSAERLLKLVEQLPEDPGLRRSAETARRSTQRALAIVNSLLDLTHLRIGKGLPLSTAPTNLGSVVHAVVDEANAESPGRVLLETTGVLDGTFDAVRIGQAVSNLLSNALKYGRPGVPVHVRVKELDDGRLEVSVENDGDPIPEDMLPYLFDPFRRGGSRHGRRESLGLGLYIVNEIARAHAGTVEVSSRAGQRTRFSLRIPRVTATSSGPAVTVPSPVTEAQPGGAFLLAVPAMRGVSQA